MTYVINNNFPNFIYAFDSASHRILLSDREGKVLRSWLVSSADGNRNFLRLLSKGWRVFHPGKAKAKKTIEALKAQDREIGLISMATASLYTAEEVEAFNKDPEVLANREKYFADI